MRKSNTFYQIITALKGWKSFKITSETWTCSFRRNWRTLPLRWVGRRGRERSSSSAGREGWRLPEKEKGSLQTFYQLNITFLKSELVFYIKRSFPIIDFLIEIQTKTNLSSFVPIPRLELLLLAFLLLPVRLAHGQRCRFNLKKLTTLMTLITTSTLTTLVKLTTTATLTTFTYLCLGLRVAICYFAELKLFYYSFSKKNQSCFYFTYFMGSLKQSNISFCCTLKIRFYLFFLIQHLNHSPPKNTCNK